MYKNHRIAAETVAADLKFTGVQIPHRAPAAAQAGAAADVWAGAQESAAASSEADLSARPTGEPIRAGCTPTMVGAPFVAHQARCVSGVDAAWRGEQTHEHYERKIS